MVCVYPAASWLQVLAIAGEGVAQTFGELRAPFQRARSLRYQKIPSKVKEGTRKNAVKVRWETLWKKKVDFLLAGQLAAARSFAACIFSHNFSLSVDVVLLLWVLASPVV